MLEVRLNAPRQGIYAALLVTSFALHAVLMIQGTEHQLAVTRAAQGELMTGQLVADSLSSVVAADTVGLALLTRRYTERADVASVRILNATGQVLASGGTAACAVVVVVPRDGSATTSCSIRCAYHGYSRRRAIGGRSTCHS